MDLIPSGRPDSPAIEACDDDGFWIGGVRHDGAVLVTAEGVRVWAVGTGAEAMSAESLAPLIAATPRPEILVLGCGRAMVPLNGALRQALREAGIAVEPMATPAACRTYNFLLMDGRRVAAALLPAG